MTRINANIPPSHLCDQHLLAEHREIIRVRHVQSSKSKAPAQFTLGKGHVLFFKDKLGFIFYRYKLLYAECKRRGFNVDNYESSFNGYDLSGQWGSTYFNSSFYIMPNQLVMTRIKERLYTMNNIRYGGNPISLKSAIELLNIIKHCV